MLSNYFLILMAVAGALAVTPETFWISPRNASVYVSAPEVLSAARGVWAEVDTGAGSRNNVPVFHVDSKGSMWIYGGSAYYPLNAMWNYDPIEDKYRWVAGNMTRNYGQKGVPADDVSPGAPYNSAHAIDKNDNIWIYGTRFDSAMWMFNTTSLQFVWIGGDESLLTPVAGDVGQASAEYWPGQLDGACMVVDSMNDLWLIGGFNAGARNGVWHFNMSSYEWSLQSGNPLALYSEPDYTNNTWPGRWLPGCTIDEDDRVWLFGGFNGNSEYLLTSAWNDMWSFDTKTVTWRVEREMNTSILNGNVVSFDTYDVNNYPRSRDSAGMVDRRDGTLMLFGGRNNFAFNDIWMFNKTSKLWKVVFGLPNNATLVHSILGTYRGAGSTLGTRAEFSVESGLNAKGNMIIFGGSDQFGVYFNDIWIIPQEQCSTNLHDCDPNASCAMATWTYTCTCNDGYTGDGKTCTVPLPVAPTVSPQTQPQSTPTSTPRTKTTSGSYRIAPSLFVALLMALLFSS